jgi:hypothetical protein
LSVFSISTALLYARKLGVIYMELIFNAVLGIIFLFFLVMSRQIPHQSTAADVVEASGFPMMFSAISLLLLAYSTYEFLRGKSETKTVTVTKEGLFRVSVVVAMTIGYILTINALSFTLVTLLFVFFCVTVIGSKRYLLNAVYAVVCTLALTLIFGRVFMISLPRGIGIIRELSFILY